MQNNYPTKKLGEVIDFLKGKKMTVTEEQRLGYEPYIGIDALRTHEYKLYTPEKNGVRCSKDDVLVVWDGAYAGTVGIEVSGFAGSTVAKVVIREPELNSRFLRYFWEFKESRIRSAAQGAAIPHLSKTFINNLKVPLPPLEIQKQIVGRLDKIVAAQKLNDELIQKADELYRSLLHNELNAKFKNQNAKSQFKIKKLKDILSNAKYSVGKLKRDEYRQSGKYPIIDQSVNDIAGYSDNEEMVYSGKLPVIIYGDHTRIVKFVNQKFILGADGTKILVPISDVLADYLYHALQLFNIESRGYKRHFPILKEVKIPLPPIETQKQIATKLSAAQDYKTQLLAQKSKLKELFNSALVKSFNG